MYLNELEVGDLTVDRIIGGSGYRYAGTEYFVDTVNGSNGNNGKSPKRAKKTLAAAYAAATANKNDVVYMLPGATADTITSAITWSKSYTHLIGMPAPVQFGPRCRVNTTTAMTPMVTWSANGCIVKGIQFSNNHSHATAGAVCFQMTGARNYLEGCHFQGLGALGVVDNSHRAFVFATSDAENAFKKCTFGTDTVDGVTATNYVMEYSGANQCARQTFEDCVWVGNGSANSAFILATTVSSLSSFQIFTRCKFINTTNGTLDEMTQAFALHVDNGGLFVFEDCLVYGAATLETTNTGKILVRNAPAAATGDILIAATY